VSGPLAKDLPVLWRSFYVRKLAASHPGGILFCYPVGAKAVKGCHGHYAAVFQHVGSLQCVDVKL